MADNKLNLVVRFNGIDDLSPAMKNIIGLGKTGKQVLNEQYKELRKVNAELKDYDKQISKATGNVDKLISAQTPLILKQMALEKTIASQKAVVAIDARTAAINRRGSELVSQGQAGLLWAGMMAAPLYEVANAGGEFQALQSRLGALGLDNRAVANLTAYSQAMNIAGSSAKDNLRYILEAQGAFRESGEHGLAEQLAGAKLMAPLLAKMEAAGQAMGQHMSEDQERYFLRFVEQAGGMNDPHRATALADGLFRALQSSGGNIQASDYQSFLARAGSAGMRLSARSLFADFEPLIAELHESAGVGLMSAFSRANGITHNSAAGAEMLRLGLWNRNAVVFNKLGGIKSFVQGRNPLDGTAAQLLSSDPVEFYRRYVLPAYAKGHVSDHQKENVMLFGKTGGQLFNLIDKQLPTILRSRQAYSRTLGLEQAYRNTTDTYFGRQGQLRAAWQDFTVAAGTKGGLLDGLTLAMRGATGALRALTGMANAHPTAFRWLGMAVTSLLAMRVGLAAARIGFGTLLSPVGQLWGLWSKYRALGSIAALFPRLASVLSIARMAVLGLGKGFLRAGAMMLANPMVLVIMAVVVALGLLGYAVYRNWDKIKAAFSSGWAWLTARWTATRQWLLALGPQIMQGLLNAINPVAFAGKMLDMAKAGIGAFRDHFHIRSPSRLMMEMGGHIATGLALGVDQHQHKPVAAMRRMSQAMSGTIHAPARGTGSRAPAPVTLHVHQQPGENAEALARRVLDLIDRRARVRALGAY